MNIIVRSTCIFLVGFTLLTGCGKQNQSSTPTASPTINTVYIGDNSKVIAIADQLPYPKGVSYSSIEIQSDTEPYELKVFLQTNNTDAMDLQQCAEEAFAKISNMGIISFYDASTQRLLQSFERK